VSVDANVAVLRGAHAGHDHSIGVAGGGILHKRGSGPVWF
jgi:hypothetical protein